ncbi:hypothetical protein KSP39_PZI014521 [Platanthera zijinensis]|uniref:Uncharacterized protein n=1 Tax=Platanthera zijinensis TaxID=2320716 RepID=A0AAP0BBP5_9ASPA
MFLRRIMTGGMWSMLTVKVKEKMGIVGLEVVPNRQVVRADVSVHADIGGDQGRTGGRRIPQGHEELHQPPPLGLRRWRRSKWHFKV